jgi:hypothetical protein
LIGNRYIADVPALADALTTPVTPPARLLVILTDPRRRSRCEGIIERIDHHATHVEVTLLLDDGRAATACLAPDQAEWHELRIGAIVGVRLAF